MDMNKNLKELLELIPKDTSGKWISVDDFDTIVKVVIDNLFTVVNDEYNMNKHLKELYGLKP